MQGIRSRLPRSWRCISRVAAMPVAPSTISTTQPTMPCSEAPIRRRSLISRRGWSCSRHFQTPLNVLSMNCAFSRSSAWRSWRPRARRTWTCSALSRVRAHFVTSWRTRPSSFGCWVGCSRFMSCGQN